LRKLENDPVFTQRRISLFQQALTSQLRWVFSCPAVTRSEFHPFSETSHHLMWLYPTIRHFTITSSMPPRKCTYYSNMWHVALSVWENFVAGNPFPNPFLITHLLRNSSCCPE
jgi:hypothetical protein